jgi:hypothetical protein
MVRRPHFVHRNRFLTLESLGLFVTNDGFGIVEVNIFQKIGAVLVRGLTLGWLEVGAGEILDPSRLDIPWLRVI